LALVGKFSWSDVGLYLLAQLLGASLGAFLVWVVYKDHFDATTDAETQLAVFSTSPAIKNLFFNLMSEIVGTFVLVFVIFYFTPAEMGDSKTPIGLGSLGAIPVAFLVWAIGLSLGGTTGYAINPVRDFGPRLVHAVLPIKEKGPSNWQYAWVPVMGPFIGAALAAALYALLHA
ncbi:MAG: aquaporin family protein, partial [Flavisolibacter sp.]|nr:aquaporin family protein [Flavisolibacter sp.]